jgi:hypothetical protein
LLPQQTHCDLIVPQPQHASSNDWHCAVHFGLLSGPQLQLAEKPNCANTVDATNSVVIPKVPRKNDIMEPFQLENINGGRIMNGLTTTTYFNQPTQTTDKNPYVKQNP